MLPLNNPERNGNPKACATAALPRVIWAALLLAVLLLGSLFFVISN
jgi:hypothetical protein